LGKSKLFFPEELLSNNFKPTLSMKRTNAGSSGSSRLSSRSNSSNGRSQSNGRSSNGRSASSSSRKTQATSSGSASEDLEKVLKNTMKDIYYAEKQLVKALNKMSKAANNEELKEGFEQHREETEGHVEKLGQAFELLGMRAAGKNCPAMDGLIEEGAEAIEEYEKGPARDAALIVAAQKVEHYEIAAYGSMHAFAEVLGHDDCAQIFQEILDEESTTDEKLTMVAETVNQEAMDASETEDEEEMEEA